MADHKKGAMMAINDESEIRELLGQKRRIAVVGASPNPARASNGVLAFLVRQGHDVIAVNPGHAGKTIHGAPVVATLADVEPPAELVDIFRNSEDAGSAVDEAIVHGAKAVWMQIGVINEAAAKRAEDAGLVVVMDRCPKIEVPRLGLLR
jgi:predicted CoA-binding protein